MDRREIKHLITREEVNMFCLVVSICKKTVLLIAYIHSLSIKFASVISKEKIRENPRSFNDVKQRLFDYLGLLKAQC